MVHITDMRRSIKGFYTLEAAVFLPFVILAILSLGYFIKIEGLWENCIHGAIDESSVIASKSYSPVETMMIEEKIKNRVTEDNKELDTIEVDNIRIMHSDFHNDSLISYEMKASEYVEFPLIFKGLSEEKPTEVLLVLQDLKTVRRNSLYGYFPSQAKSFTRKTVHI